MEYFRLKLKAALGISYVSVNESRLPPASWIQNQAATHVQEEAEVQGLYVGVLMLRVDCKITGTFSGCRVASPVQIAS